MKQRYSKLSFLVLALSILYIFVPVVRPKSLPVRIYTSADGLGSSFVNYLARDSRGFMWFCTRDGLSRFDGSQFVTYQIGEQNSQPGIENIFESSDGAYWITTTAGTYRFDPTQIYARDTGVPTLRAERVFDHRGVIYQDRKGDIWLGADALYKIGSVDGKLVAGKFDLAVPLPSGAGMIVVSLNESADGSLWVGTSVGYIRLLPNGRRVFYPDPEKRLIPGGSLRILLDRRGLVWISLLNRLFVTKPEPIEDLPVNDGPIIRDLVPTRTIDLSPGRTVTLPAVDGELYELRNDTCEAVDRREAKHRKRGAGGSCSNVDREC